MEADIWGVIALCVSVCIICPTIGFVVGYILARKGVI